MSKHPPAGRQSTPSANDDLDLNPGIGTSKGTFATGIDAEEIEGENTFEGDVDSDVDRTDAVREEIRGRTNP
ncbi:MAG TPA: hypothetical protein VF559_07375 [Caulobacteraceae bacterium]|jgi:hypothetical protein